MLDLDAAYTILVEECGAREDGREMFRTLLRHDIRRGDGGIEYRFQGALGFGGKFRTCYVNPPEFDRYRLYVDCYREDETPERLAMIERANQRLADLLHQEVAE
jgi:hypothetical protein